jgi:hypothetical protein
VERDIVDGRGINNNEDGQRVPSLGDGEALLVAHRRQRYNLTFQIRAPSSPSSSQLAHQDAFIIRPLVESSDGLVAGNERGQGRDNNEAEDVARVEGTLAGLEAAGVDVESTANDEGHVESTEEAGEFRGNEHEHADVHGIADRAENDPDNRQVITHSYAENDSKNQVEVSTEWWHFITPRQQKHYWQPVQ